MAVHFYVDSGNTIIVHFYVDNVQSVILNQSRNKSTLNNLQKKRVIPLIPTK